MKRLSGTALTVLALLTGCGKKKEAEASLPPAREAQIESQFMPVTNAANIEDRINGAVHPELTMQLQMFIKLRGRMPESFFELANSGFSDSVPALPLNMKYVIDPKDKTVKAVKK